MLAPLSALKQRLLIPANQALSTWDSELQAIGNAVADAIDRHCNRLLRYAEDHTYSLPGDRRSIPIPAFPIHQIQSITLTTAAHATPKPVAGPYNSLAPAGVVELVEPPGQYHHTLTITYAGGYKTGLESPAAPSEIPSIPHDILEAWILQCASIANESRLFEARAQAKLPEGSNPSAYQAIAIIPAAVALLRPHIRFA